MFRRYHRYALLLTLCVALMSSSVWAERAKRPMHIHKVKEMGLEIWTEYEPEWQAELVHQGKKPIFIAQTPINYYPPAAMSWVSFPGMEVTSDELEEVAASALKRAAQNYRVSRSEIDKIDPIPTTYSELNGYEATFSGTANGEAVDVKVFVGHKPGKGPVTMQVYTLPGKLPHLSEQIRRSWQNIKYLN